jgi:hypothetical protein
MSSDAWNDVERQYQSEAREFDTKLREAATFLDGVAQRLNRLPRRPFLDDAGLTQVAADCRAMARKLRGEI